LAPRGRHQALDVDAKRFRGRDISGGQGDAEKSGLHAHECVSLRKVSDQRLKRRDVGVAGLHVLDDFLQGDDQILRLLLRRCNLLLRSGPL
jgi:hypothetical protein